MPKLKTHKGISKRIKVSAGGKLLHRNAFRSHNLGVKQASRKRNYVKEFEVSTSNANQVKKMLGNK